jgi:hypothetical protein
VHDSQISEIGTSQDSSEPDERWIVHCGGGHDIEPGNVKYLERILLVQCDFMKADRAGRQSLIDDFMRDFDFQRDERRVDGCFAQEKIEKALSDRRMLRAPKVPPRFGGQTQTTSCGDRSSQSCHQTNRSIVPVAN